MTIFNLTMCIAGISIGECFQGLHVGHALVQLLVARQLPPRQERALRARMPVWLGGQAKALAVRALPPLIFAACPHARSLCARLGHDSGDARGYAPAGGYGWVAPPALHFI